MTDPSLWGAFEATWPAASVTEIAGWSIRDGQGGGKRVSATTGSGDIAVAEAAMRDLGQDALFALRGDDPLDIALAARGYEIVDPVKLLSAPCEMVAQHAPANGTVYEIWPPLAIMTDLWAEGGIGPERIAVMARVRGPKSGFLCRINARAAGVGFAAIARGHAFVHAVEVATSARRQGAGRQIMGQAAAWADRNGAKTISVAVTDANTAANALYASLGMEAVDKYHYRIRKGEATDGPAGDRSDGAQPRASRPSA